MPRPVMVIPPERFAAAAATEIADLLTEVIDRRGHATLALTGGSTVHPVYDDLVGRAIRWQQVEIFFGDERAVPPDHPESNYRLARETLLDHVPVPPSQIHRMEGERRDLDQAAQEYAAILPERFDLLLLGMGPDGHTASLFPHAPGVTEKSRRVIAADPPPLPVKPTLRRITITPPVIAAAARVLMMITGAAKAGIVARALEGPDDPAACPAQLARRGWWMLDQPAAAHLQHTES